MLTWFYEFKLVLKPFAESNKKVDDFSDSEFNLIEDICVILAPFEEVSSF